MSFDIQGIGAGAQQGAARVGATRGPAPEALTAQSTDDAVEVETMPSSPPPEVMEAISRAAEAYDQLQAGGRQLSFQADPQTGRVSAQLQDLAGNPVSDVTPSRVLAIADGDTATD